MAKESLSVRLLYQNPLGRLLLKLLTKKWVSDLGGALLSSGVSRHAVAGYIRRNRIAMERFEERAFVSFNDFFTRRLRVRPFPEEPEEGVLYAPCDGKLSAYRLGAQVSFTIKQSRYTLSELLDDEDLARKYEEGLCLIFRLTPDDYHRYCFVADGVIALQRQIPGQLHTVRPIAHAYYPVFLRNSRAYTVMETEAFGPIIQMEVGALMVGRINNKKQDGAVRFGEEKGHFAFGGSTIAMLFPKGAVTVPAQLLEQTMREEEAVVQIGDIIGERP